MIVRSSSIAALEAFPTFPALIEEYADESANPYLPRPTPDMALYHKLEAMGALHVLEAIEDDVLIGFLVIAATPLPHYGRLMAVTESFFVAKAKRHTGAGLKLIREAQGKARELGSMGLGVSAPIGSHLAEILPRLGFSRTNEVFFKRFEDA